MGGGGRIEILGRGAWAALLGTALLACGCSTTIRGWSEQSYRSPELTMVALEKGGTALLPVIILQGQQATEKRSASANLPAPYTPSRAPAEPGEVQEHNPGSGYRVILDEILLRTLKDRWPKLAIVPSGDTLKRLNDAGLAESYRRFDSSYARAGLDGATLERFGRALRVRYLLVSRAVISESASDAMVSFIWSFGRKSVLHSIKVVTQIWDTQSRQQVWEGSGVAYNRLGAYEKPPLTEQMAQVAVKQMAEALHP